MQPWDVTAEALIDILAADNNGELDFKGVMLLCSVWGVKPVIIYPIDGGRSYYDWMATVRALAQHIVQVNGANEKLPNGQN